MNAPVERLETTDVPALMQELQALRRRVEEQERELAALRTRSKYVAPWDAVRTQFMARIEKLPFRGFEASQLLAALSTIVRFRFDLSTVRYLKAEDAEEAAQIADFIASTLERRWNTEQEVKP